LPLRELPGSWFAGEFLRLPSYPDKLVSPITKQIAYHHFEKI
jgi:hypothetical protein